MSRSEAADHVFGRGRRPRRMQVANSTGEAGKVEESMAKLAAVDALKTLKQEKEVSFLHQTLG